MGWSIGDIVNGKQGLAFPLVHAAQRVQQAPGGEKQFTPLSITYPKQDLVRDFLIRL
jgi:hypothetical protein